MKYQEMIALIENHYLSQHKSAFEANKLAKNILRGVVDRRLVPGNLQKFWGIAPQDEEDSSAV